MHCPALRACAVALLVVPLSPGVALATPAETAAKRPITHEDVWLMSRPGAVAASPDGRWFVVAMSEPSYEEGQGRSDLWIVPADGSAGARRLTSGRGAEGDPVFSHDSTRLAFSARRDDDEATQIYLLNLAGGEALRVTSWPGGASYGGHLVNWLAVSTDRYRALVSHAGLFDLRTQWTTSDVVYNRERNIGGPAWEGLPLWQAQSPFHRSAQLRTPILLTYCEQDFRVPLNNGLEFWTVLQRQGVPGRLVVFPDENHWVLKGENSRYFYGEVHAWLAKYL